MEPQRSPYRVAVVGDAGVGKTALAIRMHSQRFIKDYDPTIADSYGSQALIGEQTYPLEILDTAGYENYNSMRDARIHDKAGTTHLQAPPIMNPPIMIVGNKSDMLKEREVSIERGREIAERLGSMFVETSAKTNEKVDKAFSDVVKAVHSLSRPGTFKDVASSEFSAWGSWMSKGMEGGCCIIM
ncbi:putative small G-protein Ras2 [Xylariaceae sp. FL0594]|nr:putative small G-protein Ras2 [Xylariaceae sp. FL0594]